MQPNINLTRNIPLEEENIAKDDTKNECPIGTIPIERSST